MIIPGYDVAKVEAWIAANIADLKPPFTWTKLEGGHSNLTYRIEDSKGRLAVIRRPPQGVLLPKAHDMAREWALISALQNTKVPVPRTIGFCADTSVTGALFYVMGLIEGKPLYTAADTESLVPLKFREKLAFRFIDVLAELHAIDPADVGLSDLGKHENYVGRQINAWYRSWQSSIAGAKLDDPRAHAICEFLLRNIPAQGPARIVHGDYGFHNCLVAPEGTIAAIVDWEISTLGDPLADLAYALNWFGEPVNGELPRPGSATAAEGFPSRSVVAQRYAMRTGRDLTQLDYYTGFNRWKSAAITHGVYARYMEGKKSTEGVALAELKDSIGRSLAAAELALARWQAR